MVIYRHSTSNWRAARYVVRNYTYSVTLMLHELKWESLESHRQQFCLIMLYNILKQNVHLLNYIPHAISSRHLILSAAWHADQIISQVQTFRASQYTFKFSFFPHCIAKLYIIKYGST